VYQALSARSNDKRQHPRRSQTKYSDHNAAATNIVGKTDAKVRKSVEVCLFNKGKTDSSVGRG